MPACGTALPPRACATIVLVVTDQLTTDGSDEWDVPPDTSAASHRRTWRERRRQRVSRWDRPPEPHDWRFYVGTLGQVLIATGILLFGFVAYQLWGTGIEYAASQNSLQSEFDRQLESIGINPSVDEIPNRPTDAPSALQPAGTPNVPATDDSGDGSGGDDLVPVALDLSDIAVEKPTPIVIPGETLFRLDIPRIHDDPLFVVPGVALTDLKKGPGHYSDTPLPGTLGNSAVAGHRTTYGAPFFDIDQLQSGDEIIVTMAGTGERFVYLVTSTQIVAASDYWVVTTSDPTIAELTLTSCHPKYTADDRIVVHSVLDPSQSSTVGTAAFYELSDPAADAIPGDDPLVTAPTTTVEATAAPTATTTAATDVDPVLDPPGTTAPTSTPTTTADPATVPASAAPGAIEDAFSQGWFHDPDAWPQIVLWALALALISMLGYQLSKKTRRSSVGILVAILPFLFCLYFFYQNVNRLLPPGF
jgi:sortase A